MTQVAPFFSELEKYIEGGRAAIAAGEELSLAGLDDNIDTLCTMIMALSEEERLMYEERLKELLGRLNALGLELKAQMEGVKELPKHRNASVAYQTADSRDNFGVREGDA